jgi:aldo/keto reductase family protein
MRLSTDRERDDERAFTVLHAAFDGGVTFFDTADAYCLDDSDLGHNERLIARALHTWSGHRAHRCRHEAGLTRPGGAWVPDGRARHLRAARRACVRSTRSVFSCISFT